MSASIKWHLQALVPIAVACAVCEVVKATCLVVPDVFMHVILSVAAYGVINSMSPRRMHILGSHSGRHGLSPLIHECNAAILQPSYVVGMSLLCVVWCWRHFCLVNEQLIAAAANQGVLIELDISTAAMVVSQRGPGKPSIL